MYSSSRVNPPTEPSSRRPRRIIRYVDRARSSTGYEGERGGLSAALSAFIGTMLPQ
jgi:hypothetical protein